jgi:hypothetical protein
LIRRRTFLGAALGFLLWPVAAPAREERAAPAPPLDGLLETSPYVYVSPLRSDGSESRCHGEVWYGWLDGAVVVITAADTWKARSLGQGLQRARIWVGDHGRWKRLIGRNESFREAPSFEARAARARDAELLDRLLALYETKYPAEIGRWRDRMRAGYADGSRVLIRYRPEW